MILDLQSLLPWISESSREPSMDIKLKHMPSLLVQMSKFISVCGSD